MSLTTDRLMGIGDTFDLLMINFLDKEKKTKGKPIAYVDLIFSNGEQFMITIDEYHSLGNYTFRMGSKDQLNN